MIQKNRIAVLLIVILFYPCLLFSQVSEDTEQNNRQTEALPDGFMNITLGIDMDAVKEALLENPYFNYRGEPDVSMLPSRNQNMIESSGFSFVERGYFQFYEGKLFIINLVLKNDRIDFYTMHQKFEEKYGKPLRLDPKGVYWENDKVNLYLEKPLSIKYMDRSVLAELESQRKEIEDRSSKNKQDFIDLF